MKPIADYLKEERAHRAVMTVKPDENDTFDKAVVFDFDFMYEIMQKIRKEIGPRKKQTRTMKHDNRTIQFRFKEDTSGVLLMRVYRENEKQMYPDNDQCIAIAPRVPTDDCDVPIFKDWDNHSEERAISALNAKEEEYHDQETELYKNGMFRDREDKGIPLSGSDAECNDPEEIEECAKLLGIKPYPVDVI